MAVAPDPDDIYERAAAEGRRRLGMTPVRQMTTGSIAGVTIVFGIVALGVTEALVEPTLGSGVATIVGALAFAIGIVFLTSGGPSSSPRTSSIRWLRRSRTGTPGRGGG